jgi:hypothetical protein
MQKKTMKKTKNNTSRKGNTSSHFALDGQKRKKKLYISRTHAFFEQKL